MEAQPPGTRRASTRWRDQTPRTPTTSPTDSVTSGVDVQRTTYADSIESGWDYEATWLNWFGLLEAFRAEHGHVRVPRGFKSLDGYRLGIWVSDQRKRADRLGPERRERLDALGFVWDQRSEAWQESYAHLEAFRAEHGHVRVPQRFKSLDGYRLGIWVSDQRQRADRLGPERRERLDALGFVWKVRS